MKRVDETAPANEIEMTGHTLSPSSVAPRTPRVLASTAVVGALALAVATVGVTPPVNAQSNGTILAANQGDDSVWLIDLATGERRAIVSTHIAPHEIAVTSDGRTAAITNYGDRRGPGNVVQFVTIRDGSVSHEITVEGQQRLHGAAFLPGDSLLALTSERTGEVLIVGVADGGVRRSLPTQGRGSHMLALGGRWVYTANIMDGTVTRIDLTGETPTLVWEAGTRTEGLAATPDGLQGWTASMDSGTVIGVNGATGDIVARIGGLQVPYRLAITPDAMTVVVSDPEAGTLVLIDRLLGAIVASIDIDAAAAAAGYGNSASPQGFAVSPDGQWAFVSANAINRVAIVDLKGRRVARFVEAGVNPDGMGFSPVVVTPR
jgi:YVTN family beta-propeller protein